MRLLIIYSILKYMLSSLCILICKLLSAFLPSLAVFLDWMIFHQFGSSFQLESFFAYGRCQPLIFAHQPHSFFEYFSAIAKTRGGSPYMTWICALFLSGCCVGKHITLDIAFVNFRSPFSTALVDEQVFVVAS